MAMKSTLFNIGKRVRRWEAFITEEPCSASNLDRPRLGRPKQLENTGAERLPLLHMHMHHFTPTSFSTQGSIPLVVG